MNSNNNNFFNSFQGQQNFPFNPLDPTTFVNNLTSTITNSLGQGLNGFNPFGMFGQPQESNVHAQDSNNIHINNTWNFGNNPSGQQNPNFSQNAQQNQNNAQNNQYRSNNSNQSSSNVDQSRKQNEQKKAASMNEKEREIQKAEYNPNSGHYYKRIGNDYFKKGLYAEALQNYTKAIELNDTESVFYSNRALCYKQVGELQKALKDAQIALELDDKNIKANLLCGQILAELGKTQLGTDKLDKAINRMTKALTLCAGQNKTDFENDLKKIILRARKVKWLKLEDEQIRKKKDLVKYLKGTIEKDTTIEQDRKEETLEEAINIIGNPDMQPSRDIPDYLCCKITMDLLEEPVITPVGITYEKAALVDHLSRNGHFDPVTRKPMEADQYFPNLTIKQAVETFLKDNPWAFEYQYNENYRDVKF